MRRNALVSAAVLMAGGAQASDCALYLADSTLPGAGRGVFAGTDIGNEDLVSADTSILMYEKDSKGTMMRNYMYSATDLRAYMSMGYGSLFNHHNPPSMENFWRDDVPSEDRRDRSFFKSSVDSYAKKDIAAGEEIFSSYGEESWFRNRGVEHIGGEGSLSRSLEDLEATGFCLSDVSVHQSDVRGVGLGLYAERSFEKGELVSISPVLFLSKKMLLDAGPGSLMLNYAISVPGSDVALLPVSSAAMVNNGGKGSSLELHWYDWENRQVLEGSDIPAIMDEWTVDELEAAPFAALDIAYVATRDIEEGEELTLYYGKEWARAFRGYKRKKREDPDSAALFRHPINAAPDMFPEWWMVDCVGSACEDMLEDQQSAEPEAEARTDCELYMAPSTMGGVGRGLFAGVDLPERAAFDLAPALTFPLNKTVSTQLINFAFSSHNNAYVMAVLGPSMILNHAENWENTDYHYATKMSDLTDPAEPQTSPHTNYASLYFSVTTDVSAGEELFTNYGGEEWFEVRGIPYDSGADSLDVDDRSRDLRELSAIGHCLTDVGVYESDIHGAGEGLFAERNFKVGEVVSISPVLLLPKHVLNDTTANSVMINYVLSVPGSDVALLPIGRAAMANHGGKEANMEIHWYDWQARRPLYDDKVPNVIRERSVDALEASPFSSLDLSYVATRDIERGEELTFDYGDLWETAWKEYQSALWRRKQLLNAVSEPPVFRHPIGLKPAMFADNWMVDCIGASCGRGSKSCGLYMAQSTIPGVGRGIFAGKSYRESDIVDVSSTLTFPLEEIQGTQLMSFIFASDHEDYIMSLLGPGMIFNHRNDPSTGYYWWKGVDDVIPDASAPNYSPYSTYTSIFFKALKPISPGDEIFTTYGDSEWFETRDINYREAPMTGKVSRTLEELRAFGHCLTDVAVRTSGIPGAGQGLFAERSFKAGEVVSIVPVLILPKHILSSDSLNSVLINYVLSLPQTDITLYPLGRAVMTNNGGKDSNMKVQWYDWDSRRVLHGSERPKAVNEVNVDDLEASPYAALDICYVATRDIAEGEELTINYGGQWEAAWNKYREALDNTPTFGNSPRPLFLEAVGAEPEMFPESWFVSCLGDGCDDEDEEEASAQSVEVEEQTTASHKPSFDIAKLIKEKVGGNSVQWSKKDGAEASAKQKAADVAAVAATDSTASADASAIDSSSERNEL